MSSKLSAVIIGHSFVARLDNALIMERPAGCIVPQQHLTPVQLEVDDLFNNIYIEGRAGAKVTSLTQAVDLAGSRRPNVVLFIAGSNDLCDLGADPRQVATDSSPFSKRHPTQRGQQFQNFPAHFLPPPTKIASDHTKFSYSPVREPRYK